MAKWGDDGLWFGVVSRNCSCDNGSRDRVSKLVYSPRKRGVPVTLLSDDPDAAWQNLGSLIMNEAVVYRRWMRPGIPRPHDTDAGSIDAARNRNIIQIPTPGELIGQIDSRRGEVVMIPLFGGLPLEAGWAALPLFGDVGDARGEEDR